MGSPPEVLLDEILQRLVHTPDIIYLSGSQSDGFGHSLSDTDIFVLSSDPTLLADKAQIDFKGEERWDIEYWPISYPVRLAALLSKFAQDQYDPGKSPHMEVKDRNFIHRLVIGQPIHGTESFNQLRSQVDIKSLSLVNYWIYQDSFQSMHEDVVGLLESEDFDTALLTLLYTFRNALEAFLSTLGENYVSPKWTLRKLKKVGRMDMYKSFCDLLMGPRDEPVKSFIERHLDKASQILLEANIT